MSQMNQDSLQKEFYPAFFAEQWNRKFNQILTETFLFSNENLNYVKLTSNGGDFIKEIYLAKHLAVSKDSLAIRWSLKLFFR